MMGSISLQGIRSSDRESDAVISMISKLRDRTQYRCPIVLAVESAPGIAASHIERYLRESQLPNVLNMCERNGYMEGVPKTEAISHEYYYEIDRHLKSEYLVYASDIITYHKRAEKEKERMKTMMANLRAVPRRSNQEHGEQRYKITAKISGQADDMFVALCMALYWRRKFWTDNSGKYTEFQNRIRAYRDITFAF
jgi:hypothetical protein